MTKTKKSISILGILLVQLLVAMPTMAGSSQATRDLPLIDAIVLFKPGIKVPTDLQGVEIKHRYDALNGFSGRMSLGLYEQLKAAWFVQAIGENGRAHACAGGSDTLDWGVDGTNAEVVWGGAEDATDIISGRPTGAGVKIAVLDSGIDYNHGDLASNYKGGYDFVDDDSDPKDKNGHGTHVAGIIAARDNEYGVIGVAPKASLYAVRVLDAQGDGNMGDVCAGINWAINNNMDIITMSLTGPEHSPTASALQTAYNSGIVCVAASGNSDNDEVSFPACLSTVIAVGALEDDDTRWDLSNYGTQLELVAPGADIYSAWKGSSFATKSGTSFATPMVTGTIALLLSCDPSLTPAEIRSVLQTTAWDLGDSGWDQYFGYGKVNTMGAYLYL
ncbi:MAG: S8 family peptidase [Candidatus Thorarchaeota archaeon]